MRRVSCEIVPWLLVDSLVAPSIRDEYRTEADKSQLHLNWLPSRYETQDIIPSRPQSINHHLHKAIRHRPAANLPLVMIICIVRVQVLFLIASAMLKNDVLQISTPGFLAVERFGSSGRWCVV